MWRTAHPKWRHWNFWWRTDNLHFVKISSFSSKSFVISWPDFVMSNHFSWPDKVMPNLMSSLVRDVCFIRMNWQKMWRMWHFSDEKVTNSHRQNTSLWKSCLSCWSKNFLWHPLGESSEIQNYEFFEILTTNCWSFATPVDFQKGAQGFLSCQKNAEVFFHANFWGFCSDSR